MSDKVFWMVWRQDGIALYAYDSEAAANCEAERIAQSGDSVFVLKAITKIVASGVQRTKLEEDIPF